MNNDFNQKSRELVVGLDAGGTRTRAVLAAAADGRVLGEGAAGPGNALTVPLPRLTDHLAEALARAVPESARGRVAAVAGGFAGATGAAEDDPGRLNALTALTAALRRLGIGTASIGISSDIEAAFASAPGTPADGLALVAGTGAVAMRITGRRCTATVDGDGWLLGDDGSGFWIGREAVRAALRMADGRGGQTTLAGAVGRTLGLPREVLPGGRGPGAPPVGPGASHGGPGPGVTHGSPGADAVLGTPTPVPGAGSATWALADREAYRMHLLPVVMAEPPTRLARLAPLVAEAAREKDPVAAAILDEAAGQLTDTVRALVPQPGERVVATGGLLGPGGPLTALLTTRLQALGLSLDWVADGCAGSVALARLLL
ncbi:N-acetylglucosamine kinase [Streptomyces sp. NPDC049541]|uniref:N-acetylglucosamine kinase n=1 Tax=Streptomyces sp. NPDC049541 TaxID=3365594 RepID=UPI0037B97C18